MRRMSSRVFVVFFLLLVAPCRLCGAAPATVTAPSRGAADVFVTTDQGDGGVGAKYFTSPLLVAADGVLAALAVRNRPGNGDDMVDTVVRRIATTGSGGDWQGRWSAEEVVPNMEESDTLVSERCIVAAAAEKTIYILHLNHKGRLNAPETESEGYWDLDLSVGDVSDEKFAWKTTRLMNKSWTKPVNGEFSSVLMRDGCHSGFVTRDGRVVFVIKALKKDNSHFFVLVHSRSAENKTDFELSYVSASSTCFSTLFFPWEEKIMMLNNCIGAMPVLKESSNMGRTWTAAVGPISRLWDYIKEERVFTTMTVENRFVLLVTQLRETEMGTAEKRDIHLWVTDGDRLHEVGAIVTGNSYVTPRGLVHTKGTLFFLQQSFNGRADKVVVKHLRNELENIRLAVRAWVKADETLLQRCERAVLSDTPCLLPVPTNGLVGFWSNSSGGNVEWRDEYHYMNATVQKGTKVENGFSFHEPAAKAWWFIGRQWGSQRYNFARYGLTVVATVTVHSAPKSGSAPLLTLDGAMLYERTGLWCTSDMKWKVRSKWIDAAAHGDGLKLGIPYHVAVTLHNNNATVYVDGAVLGSMSLAPSQNNEDVQYFFVGGCEDIPGQTNGDTVAKVTVTNVLLYNRPLSAAEVAAALRVRAC